MQRPAEGETEDRDEGLLPPPSAAALGPGSVPHEEGSLGSGFGSSHAEAVVGRFR